MKPVNSLFHSFLIVICGFLISTTGWVHSQTFALGPWKQLYLKGLLRLESLYRSQETILKSSRTEFPSLSFFSGELQLESKSYIWHPNFLLVNLDVKYNPAKQYERFLVIPDRSEVRTLEGGGFQTTFFNQKPIFITFFGNYAHNFINRESLISTESVRRNWGGVLSIRNKFLPMIFNFNQGRWEQEEIPTGRIFKNYEKRFQARFTKAFSSLDEHQFTISSESFLRDYTGFTPIKNEFTTIFLKNRFFFNKKKETSLNSVIQFHQLTGFSEYDRLQIYESFVWKLPINFRLQSNYQFWKFNQEVVRFNQHNFSNRLEHRLFLSLRTTLYNEYSYLDHSSYKETINLGGISFNYRKKIPTGLLSLHYEIRERREDRDGASIVVQIVNEQHELRDGSPVLLRNPYVIPNTVIITDPTETIIYQENVDYILIERGNFLEVQRIPGGQIENGATVYIDYQVSRQDTYKFNSLFKSYGGNISLFKHAIELYYRASNQDYNNVELFNEQVLKFFNQKIWGGKIAIGFLSGGVEYDDFRSNIVPYRSLRYFINATGSLNGKFQFAIIGDRKHIELTEDNEKQIFTDITGKTVYNIGRLSKINLEGSLRLQEGARVDLNLVTFRGELSVLYRQVILSSGFEIFRRDFFAEKINYNGLYLRVERRF